MLSKQGILAFLCTCSRFLHLGVEMKRDRGKYLHLGLGKRIMNVEGTSLSMDANTDNRLCDEMNDCLSLQSKHKIFLSHSGAQKHFVERLCEDLETCHRFPIFDKRPSSLPKGERFPELIIEAAQQCEMAVVVVSEEYFMSKWPMIELNSFVRALSGSNLRLRILPLFFGLSVSEVGNPSRQAQWFNEWDKWAMDDARIDPIEFKSALKVMRSFNDIEFNQNMREVGSYQRIVVSSICSAISPDVKWDDAHVQGAQIYAIGEKIKEIEPSNRYGVCVFGYYGMDDTDKITMCKVIV